MFKKVFNFYKKHLSKLWEYEGSYAEFPDKIVYDTDVAKHARKHLRLIDFLDFRKITTAILWSFDILQADENESFDELFDSHGKYKF